MLSWLVGLNTLIGLILFALAQSLRLPSNFGVEDWLGWRDLETLRTALEVWAEVHGKEHAPAAAAYLLLDTALFMPIYGLTLLWATWHLRAGWASAKEEDPIARAIAWAAVPLLCILWCLDTFENVGGLLRLGMSPWLGFAALIPAGLVLWRVRVWTISVSRRDLLIACLLMLLILVAVSVTSFRLDVGTPRADGPFGGAAHRFKPSALLLAILPAALLWLRWWFGLDTGGRTDERGNSLGAIRAACRQTALGIVGRTRYVLAMLVLFGVLTLGLDQCRDVLLALVTTDVGVIWCVVMLGSAIGLAMMSHACWLWARLVCRIRRSGYTTPGLGDVAEWSGEFARSWARLLMLMPMLMAAMLIANVAGDAVIAARGAPLSQGLMLTEMKLAGFAIGVIGIAAWLMQRRRRTSRLEPADYYNSVEDIRALLHDPYVKATVAAPAPLPGPLAPQRTARLERARQLGSDTLRWLAHPVTQPIGALVFFFIARAAMLLWPEATGLAPPALAVLSLSMVWWLGPLGLIALAEQRTVFPWALLLLALAGLIGLGSDNHMLPLVVFDDPDLTPGRLEALRLAALAGIAVLCAVSAWTWWALAAQDGGAGPAPDATRRVHGWRWKHLVGAAVLLGAGLVLVDRTLATDALPKAAPERVAVNKARPPAPLPTPAGAPLLLVASEGGGVRAAYWTARVLSAVEEANPGWSSRIVAMSGVSGGSMGLAVWRACLRGDQGTKTLSQCVEDGFRTLDPLSPLLAGLMFEDVWMRFVPSDWLCRQATGCGMRSRALGFEREWVRAYPRLGEPLVVDPVPRLPDLLLNNTIVESGNRGVFSTRSFQEHQLPGAEDLIATKRVTQIPSLVTAAHASARFPLTNPLASLPKSGSGRAAAHLVDGGYHDNSGAFSLADVLTDLRARGVDGPVQLVLIRNGQVPTSCLPQALKSQRDQPPPACLKIKPDARELLPPRDSQRLGLFADLLGPAVTALNNLGTGSHGRQAVAALTARVAGAGADSLKQDMGCADASPICLLDQVQDASLVPLGWSLSRAARAAMDKGARCLARDVAEARKQPTVGQTGC